MCKNSWLLNPNITLKNYYKVVLTFKKEDELQAQQVFTQLHLWNRMKAESLVYFPPFFSVYKVVSPELLEM